MATIDIEKNPATIAADMGDKDKAATSTDGATCSPSSASASASGSDTVTVPSAVPKDTDGSGGHVGPPPDGGRRAWLTILGAFFISFVQFGMANAYGIFQAYYETHQLAAHTPDEIAWIGSIGLFILYGGGMVTGRFYDAYGPHVLLVPGTFLFVLSLELVSVCTRYWHFMLVQGVLFGTACALIFQPTVATPSQWFARRRALATSIVIAGSGLGGTLWPIAFRRMIDEIGFAWTLRTAGFISLVLMSVGCLLIRARLPRRKLAPWSGLLHPFKDTRYALLVAGACLGTWGMFTPFFYITTYAARLGAAPSLAFYTLSLVNAGSTLGRLFAGLGDRVGKFNLISVCSAVLGILLLAFWIPLASVPALIAFGVLYGFVLGFVISLIPTCAASISPPHEIGTRIGMAFAAVALFVLSGPPINGALIRAGASHGEGGGDGEGKAGYTYVGVFSGVVCLLAAGCFFLSKLRVDRDVRALV